MKHVIKLKLSPSSVLAAWGKLNAYKTKLNGAIDRATENLMDDAAEILRENVSYFDTAMNPVTDEDRGDASFSVFSERTGSGFLLTLQGDAVGFIEFGTGAYVDEQHMFRENAPFPVFSGSYSDTVGAGTWNAWIRAGKDPEKYPFNRYPQRPLYNTSEWIREHWAEYLRKEIEAIDIG